MLASFLGADPLVLLELVAGAAAGIRRGLIRDRPIRLRSILLMLMFVSILLVLIAISKNMTNSAEVPFSLHSLFLYFLKAGAPGFMAAGMYCLPFYN